MGPPLACSSTLPPLPTRADGGGGGGYRGGGGGGGGGGRGGGGWTNELGFHGAMSEDPHLEHELYGDLHSTGINFEKYDEIPVETSGDGCPEPLLEFNLEILGERLIKVGAQRQRARVPDSGGEPLCHCCSPARRTSRSPSTRARRPSRSTPSPLAMRDAT